MSDVPNVTRQEVTVRARHRFFLEGPFHGQKAPSKLLNDASYAYLTLINQAVGWVRPQACRYSPGAGGGDAVGINLEFPPPGTFEPIEDMIGGGPFELEHGQWNCTCYLSKGHGFLRSRTLLQSKFSKNTEALSPFSFAGNCSLTPFIFRSASFRNIAWRCCHGRSHGKTPRVFYSGFFAPSLSLIAMGTIHKRKA